jgi:hypothetical protein
MSKAIIFASAAMIGVFVVFGPAAAQVAPQTVEFAKVNVQKLAAGYRASKVIGSSVANNDNETIGKIDDLLVSSDGGPIDPAECAGHRRPFPAGRIGFAGKQIRPDGDALWYNSARSNPEPAKWGSEQGSRTPRQQIRADGQTVGCQVSELRHPKLDQPAIWDDERPSQLPQPRHCAGRWWGSAGSQPCRCRQAQGV